MLLLGERPGGQFYAALLIMTVSTVLMVKDTIALQHTHEHTHTHSHLHVHEGDGEAHTHQHKDLNDHNHLHAAL